jgi:hypothetical protein
VDDEWKRGEAIAKGSFEVILDLWDVWIFGVQGKAVEDYWQTSKMIFLYHEAFKSEVSVVFVILAEPSKEFHHSKPQARGQLLPTALTLNSHLMIV